MASICLEDPLVNRFFHLLLIEDAYLVENVNRGDIHPVSFNYVDQIVRRRPRLSNGYISIANFIFAQDGFNFILVDICQRHSVGDSNSTLLLLTDSDIWRLLV